MTFKDCNLLDKGLRCFPVICLLHNPHGHPLCIITTEIWVISRRQSVNQHVTEDFSPKGQSSLAPFTQTNLYSRTRKGLKMLDIPHANYHLHPISPCERKKHLENICLHVTSNSKLHPKTLACQVRYGLAPKVNLIGQGMSVKTCAANTFSNCSKSITCLLFQEHCVGHWSKWLIRKDNDRANKRPSGEPTQKAYGPTSFKRSRSDQISDLHKYWDVWHFYGCMQYARILNLLIIWPNYKISPT